MLNLSAIKCWTPLFSTCLGHLNTFSIPGGKLHLYHKPWDDLAGIVGIEDLHLQYQCPEEFLILTMAGSRISNGSGHLGEGAKFGSGGCSICTLKRRQFFSKSPIRGRGGAQNCVVGCPMGGSRICHSERGGGVGTWTGATTFVRKNLPCGRQILAQRRLSSHYD